MIYMVNTYTAGRLAQKLNINKETIRYYEKINLLAAPKKGKNGYRLYSEKDMQIIRFIIAAKGFGFSLKEIKFIISNKMLCGNVESAKKIIKNKLDDINSKIKELESAKKLLEKINHTILSQDIMSCRSVENFIKNNS